MSLLNLTQLFKNPNTKSLSLSKFPQMYVLRKKKPHNRSSSVKTGRKNIPIKKEKRDCSPTIDSKQDLDKSSHIILSSDPPNIPNIKEFHFVINNKSFLHGQVQIDISKLKKIQDLKKKLASLIDLQPNNINISGFQSTDDLIKIPNKFILKVSIKNPTNDIKFKLPTNQVITITNSSTMNLDQIIQQFQEHNLYFSQRSITSNLTFFIWNFEIPKSDFELSFVPENAIILIKLNENFVKIKLRNKLFIFTNGESISSTNIINKAFNFPDKLMVKFIPEDDNPTAKKKVD